MERNGNLGLVIWAVSRGTYLAPPPPPPPYERNCPDQRFIVVVDVVLYSSEHFHRYSKEFYLLSPLSHMELPSCLKVYSG